MCCPTFRRSYFLDPIAGIEHIVLKLKEEEVSKNSFFFLHNKKREVW